MLSLCYNCLLFSVLLHCAFLLENYLFVFALLDENLKKLKDLTLVEVLDIVKICKKRETQQNHFKMACRIGEPCTVR
jgi:hypothetical protein